MPTPSMRTIRLSALVPTALLLAGCASFSADGGFAPIAQTAKEKLDKDVLWTRGEDDRSLVETRVAELLRTPLDAEAAVQLALLNNRGLQASFHELGIAEADLVQAGRPPNPRFAMLRAQRGSDVKIEQSLTVDVLALLTMPLAREVEQRRFAGTQRQIAQETLRLAAETRMAYYDAVAAGQTAAYAAQTQSAADAGAELARRMAQAGNWSALAQAKEESFQADAVAQANRAAQNLTSARERLARLLGAADFELPQRLPDLPKAAAELPDIETTAMATRLDLQAIRLNNEALAKNLGLTRTTRLVNVLEIGPARVLEGQRGDPYQTGYEVAFELPLFDWGTARVAKAESIYMQSLDRSAEAAVNARSEVRESYRNYRGAYDLARHYRDSLLPLKKRVSDETLLRYNGMLASVFDLLADARAQIAAASGYIEALRDFWRAQANLDMALLGKPLPPGASVARTE